VLLLLLDSIFIVLCIVLYFTENIKIFRAILNYKFGVMTGKLNLPFRLRFVDNYN
jgi:hypothetical protein